ncbi:ABC transporter permease [Reticulibacter mediterranei]|uniref:ABC transporter permease n=1 Tax=Reticulibacter mediterranei TaxID=2778369 RepID=A0A8J3IQS9_9CHLR|nr:carbohydrate ABC transporter permease [Reticulibacter mediterranei]GHO99056.1 ABC transporter permease [Reticulibacter mediterranei]
MQTAFTKQHTAKTGQTIRRQTSLKKWLLTLLMLVLVLILDYPIFTIFLNAFRSTAEILSTASIIPQHPTLANFSYLNDRTNFWGFFTSSMVVAVIGTITSIICAATAGYALSRYHSLKFVSGYSRGLMLMQMFPLILALIPLFIIFRNTGLVNTYWSVILIYTVLNLPFATWMFEGFFDAIPRELEEAAAIDGCSRFQGLIRIVLPLSGPGTAAVTIFTFLLCYNEYLIANIFLRDPDTMTIPVGIQMFMQQYSTDWGSLMAAACLASIPTIVFFLFVQKYMVRGVVAGAVKG